MSRRMPNVLTWRRRTTRGRRFGRMRRGRPESGDHAWEVSRGGGAGRRRGRHLFGLRTGGAPAAPPPASPERRRVGLPLPSRARRTCRLCSCAGRGNAALDPAVADARRLTQEFAGMVRNLEGEKLDGWLEEAASSAAPAMRRFASGLEKDLAAVRAGLTGTWSNGPGRVRPQTQAGEAAGPRPGGLRPAEGEGAGGLTTARKGGLREVAPFHQEADRAGNLWRGLNRTLDVRSRALRTSALEPAQASALALVLSRSRLRRRGSCHIAIPVAMIAGTTTNWTRDSKASRFPKGE